MPKGLDNIFLVNSGGEANDLAIQLTKMWKGNQHFICLRNCYHGMVIKQQNNFNYYDKILIMSFNFYQVGSAYHITSMSTWKHNLAPMPGLERALFPDVYRGPFQ